MFLARMGKGRTVREFVLVEVLVPSLFCCLFIAIFAGQIISVQTSGITDVWAMIQQEGMQTTLYQVLGSMPFGNCLPVLYHFGRSELFCTVYPVCTWAGN